MSLYLSYSLASRPCSTSLSSAQIVPLGSIWPPPDLRPERFSREQPTDGRESEQCVQPVNGYQSTYLFTTGNSAYPLKAKYS